MKKRILLPFLLLLWFTSSSHIGSPGVIYEGLLGPYRILANIIPAEVVPGIAKVTIILPENPENITLEVRPVYWSAGLKGTPKADPMFAVPGEPGKYEGELWFMNSGTSSVQVMMQANGQIFEAIVPVMAWPTAKNSMTSELGIPLTILGIFLVILMVTIISSAMSDSINDPGKERNPAADKRRKIGIIIGSTIMLLILWGGKTWWDTESEQYNNFLFKPIEAKSRLKPESDGNYLHLEIDTNTLSQGQTTRKLSFIVPDHGKLMHLFLIRKGDLDVFAHLHPERIDSLNFKVKLPSIPAGDYHVYADITRYTGFSETIISDFTIPENSNFQLISNTDVALGRDDTYTFSNPISGKKTSLDGDIMICGKPGIKTDLPEGYSAVWETDGENFETGTLYNLDFALFDAEGNPALLEPYLGMMGHAVVLKHDGSVYIHLHPTGNYSMGSQQMLLDRFESGKIGFQNLPTGLSFKDSIDGVIKVLNQLPEQERDSLLMGNMVHLDPTDPEHIEHSMVSFPYAFPQPGNYRIWVQVKIDGKIVNGAFDVEVD
ncbi:hypothetical protein [Aquiflexum gelatinilyticum]|uniref:Uncharacterized protein n=1 Tax=Aquiflexum gelatinilyticum TaxID=2961943 RepID=A0A9X2SZM5_9BACT|nr:hypothetical protein [Aquiflexum gelatinilyticum]MCR9014076.1 hypothetical protein [Aquiflexum gelatinilyticum]